MNSSTPITISTQLESTTKSPSLIIDLSDAIADITENIIADSEYSDLPSDIFIDAVKRAINDLVDDFVIEPDKYLQTEHLKQIDTIAHEYLHS